MLSAIHPPVGLIQACRPVPGCTTEKVVGNVGKQRHVVCQAHDETTHQFDGMFDVGLPDFPGRTTGHVIFEKGLEQLVQPPQ